MRIEDLARSEQPIDRSTPSRGGGRVLLFVLFVLYLVLLAWIVLWKLEVPHIGRGGIREVKFVPFAPDTCDGASAPSEVLANVLLFIPFGVYLGLVAPTWPWWRITGTVAAASVSLEVAQYVLAVGSSDITDLITNTVGGLTGLGLLALARRRLKARTVTTVTRVCAVLTVLALLAIAVFVASPLRFVPRDVMVSSPGMSGEGPGLIAGERVRPDQDAHRQQCREDPFWVPPRGVEGIGLA
jgi:glycopeptide antibiotics resistance protein